VHLSPYPVKGQARAVEHSFKLLEPLGNPNLRGLFCVIVIAITNQDSTSSRLCARTSFAPMELWPQQRDRKALRPSRLTLTMTCCVNAAVVAVVVVVVVVVVEVEAVVVVHIAQVYCMHITASSRIYVASATTNTGICRIFSSHSPS
jgi:hypothetical protein